MHMTALISSVEVIGLKGDNGVELPCRGPIGGEQNKPTAASRPRNDPQSGSSLLLLVYYIVPGFVDALLKIIEKILAPSTFTCLYPKLPVILKVMYYKQVLI